MTPYERSLMKGFEVPLPAKDATHAYLFIGGPNKKKATVPLKDFDTLIGSIGKITYGKYSGVGRSRGWARCGKAFNWNGEKAV